MLRHTQTAGADMFKRFLAVLIVAAGSVGPAQAAGICIGCERVDAMAATYLGAHNPVTFDVSSFQHTDLQDELGQSAAFNDFFVFTVTGMSRGSVSVDFTIGTRIESLAVGLFSDDGSLCPPDAGAGCDDRFVGPGLGVPDSEPELRRVELVWDDLAAGTYVLRIAGVTSVALQSAYTGLLAVVPAQIDEPALPALFGLGLLAAGIGARRRRAG